VTLPVTSFPYFPPAIGGEALVRPLSLYPLAILIFLVVMPRLVNRPIPKTLLCLLPFVLVAAASSLLSLLRGIEPALGISVTARVLRGMSTLTVGCAIYVAVSLLPENASELRFTLRWIYIGCGLALLWGTLQAFYILHYDPAWFDSLAKIQQYISIRRLISDRISGLTYEPHWFADQLILLLLPGTLAAIRTGETVFRTSSGRPLGWRWLTIEWLLLGWAVLLLPFTYSRSGLLNLVLLTLLSLLLVRQARPKDREAYTEEGGAGNGQNWNRRIKAGKDRPYIQWAKACIAVMVVILPIYLVGSRNGFFARIWKYWQREEVSFTGYLSSLGFDARQAYSEAALHTYQAYPFLGVGLGNYAFYIEEMLPYRPLALIPEVLRTITPEKGRDRLVTAKNFYLRLLAETGIVGTAAFMAFVIANLGCALWLWHSPEREQRFWGVASLFGLIAFGVSAFTFDSFVIPNMWVVFGLVTAATRIFAEDVRRKRETGTQVYRETGI
jgi:O-antigen ligase